MSRILVAFLRPPLCNNANADDWSLRSPSALRHRWTALDHYGRLRPCRNTRRAAAAALKSGVSLRSARIRSTIWEAKGLSADAELVAYNRTPKGGAYLAEELRREVPFLAIDIPLSPPRSASERRIDAKVGSRATRDTYDQRYYRHSSMDARKSRRWRISSARTS